MVEALLAGRKTMTRRLLYTLRTSKKGGVVPATASMMQRIDPATGRRENCWPGNGRRSPEGWPLDHGPDQFWTLTPWAKVKPGDRLWVRERLLRSSEGHWRYYADGALILLRKGDPRVAAMVGWAHHYDRNSAPSIHMPRWASRLTLIVTATKIERLHDIRDSDAQAEGMYRRKMIVEGEEIDGWFGWNENGANTSARGAFEVTWCGLHGLSSWEKNPWVVALTFEVHKQQIDQLEQAA